MVEANVPDAERVTFTWNTKQEMAQLLKQQMNKNALRMPLQRDLLDELNVEKYELTKTGRITFKPTPIESTPTASRLGSRSSTQSKKPPLLCRQNAANPQDASPTFRTGG